MSLKDHATQEMNVAKDLERFREALRRAERERERRFMEAFLDPDPVGRIFREAEARERQVTRSRRLPSKRRISLAAQDRTPSISEATKSDRSAQ